ARVATPQRGQPAVATQREACRGFKPPGSLRLRPDYGVQVPPLGPPNCEGSTQPNPRNVSSTPQVPSGLQHPARVNPAWLKPMHSSLGTPACPPSTHSPPPM